jgi:hypothetical protein
MARRIKLLVLDGDDRAMHNTRADHRDRSCRRSDDLVDEGLTPIRARADRRRAGQPQDDLRW